MKQLTIESLVTKAIQDKQLRDWDPSWRIDNSVLLPPQFERGPFPINPEMLIRYADNWPPYHIFCIRALSQLQQHKINYEDLGVDIKQVPLALESNAKTQVLQSRIRENILLYLWVGADLEDVESLTLANILILGNSINSEYKQILSSKRKATLSPNIFPGYDQKQ